MADSLQCGWGSGGRAIAGWRIVGFVDDKRMTTSRRIVLRRPSKSGNERGIGPFQ